MARSYGRFTTTIVRDDDFRALTAEQQGVYFLLGLQPEVTAAGTLPLTLRRWASMSSGMTVERLTVTLQALVDSGHLVIDWDTEELLITKFVKWDGGIGNEKRRPVILEAGCAIASRRIRHRLAYEIAKLGWAPIAAEIHPDWASDTAPDSQSDTESGFDRVVVTEGEYIPQPLHRNPQPATLVPVAQARPAPTRRGTRLPDDWAPNDETRRWTLDRLPTEDVVIELEKFRNHWTAKTGKDATKLDWDKTWRNWVLNSRTASRGRDQKETDGLFSRSAQRMGVAQ